MNVDAVVIVGAVLVIGLIAIAVAWMWMAKNKPDVEPKRIEPFEYTPPANFRVFNHLPNNSIRVDILQYVADPQDPAKNTNQSSVSETMTKGNQYISKTLVEKIEPKKTGGISRPDVVKYLISPNVIRIFIINPATGEGCEYTDYEINTDRKDRIKNLHVGMITTRFLGSTDSLRMSTTAGNAINGCAYLIIHNLTKKPLRLNDDIVVEPHSTFRYLGYLNQGITLGFYFKDQDGVYPDFQYLQPHSDLFYGMVSDIPQPLMGCFQPTGFNDECDYGQTLWPFQEGVM